MQTERANSQTVPPIHFPGSRPELNRFRAEVLNGLRKPQKELPSKFFYDERGSQLFEQISALDEYYPTRTEMAIMEEHIGAIAADLGPHALLFEYGSGNSAKTRILLSHLRQPAAYVPIDISREQLLRAARQIAADYPGLEVIPIHADYTTVFDLPEVRRPVARNVVYFPGSTFGNFDPLPAQQFLERIARICGPNGVLLIGIDLKKDPVVLHRAYNDRQGVTADFNLNLLARINRELGADFRLDRFKHYAFYNPREGRVEMHLVSDRDQTVRLGGTVIPFARGESIWTESSYKFNVDEFAEMAAAAGFKTEQAWLDRRGWFGVLACAVR